MYYCAPQFRYKCSYTVILLAVCVQINFHPFWHHMFVLRHLKWVLHASKLHAFINSILLYLGRQSI